MNYTEKTAAVALCKAVREHYLPARYWFQIPPTIEAALTALERAINAADFGMGQPVAVGEGWRELGPDEVTREGDEWTFWPGNTFWDTEENPGETVALQRKDNRCESLRYRRRVETPAPVKTGDAVGWDKRDEEDKARHRVHQH